MNLRGANTILTGASRGLGVHMADALARAGTNLVLAARSEEDLQIVAKRVEGRGVRALAVPTDVSDRGSLEGLVQRAEAELGSVDVVVNNAGIESYSTFHDYDLDTMERILRVNLIGAMTLTRLVLPQMMARNRGHIVNVASVAGKTAVPYNVVYSTSKHGLVGFSWSLREEMAPHGIGVSVVCPGFVSDAGMFNDWSKGESPPGMTKMVSPDDVARAVIKSIEKDVAETIVAKFPMNLVDVTHAISPRFTTFLARRTGAYSFLKKATTREQRL